MVAFPPLMLLIGSVLGHHVGQVFVWIATRLFAHRLLVFCRHLVRIEGARFEFARVEGHFVSVVT